MAKVVTLRDLNENLIIQNRETEHVALETVKVKMKVDDLSKNIGYLTETMILIQKEKDIEKQRAKARDEILKNLNPIVKNYMNEKKIRVVMDKKNILLADETLDITKDIMALLNKKLKSINLN